VPTGRPQQCSLPKATASLHAPQKAQHAALGRVRMVPSVVASIKGHEGRTDLLDVLLHCDRADDVSFNSTHSESRRELQLPSGRQERPGKFGNGGADLVGRKQAKCSGRGSSSKVVSRRRRRSRRTSRARSWWAGRAGESQCRLCMRTTRPQEWSTGRRKPSQSGESTRECVRFPTRRATRLCRCLSTSRRRRERSRPIN